MKKWLKRGMACCLCLVLALSLAVCAQAGAYPIAVIYNTDEPYLVNLRASASTSANSLGMYYSGTQVEVHDTKGDWCRVIIYGREGYMQKRFLVDAGSQGDVQTPAVSFDARPTGVVSNPNPADRLNLRGRPSESWAAYDKYYNGTEVLIMGEVDGWYHVLIENSNSGFMMAKFVKKGQHSDTGSIGIAVDTAVVISSDPANRVHLRKEASKDGTSLGKYYSGVVVDVLRYENRDWALVRVGDVVGYMLKEFLAFGADGARVSSAIPSKTVSSAACNEVTLRETPNAKGEAITVYPSGTTMEVWGIAGDGWVHVCVYGQIVGYVQEKYLK